MLSHLVSSFSKLAASTIVDNMTTISKTFDYLGIIYIYLIDSIFNFHWKEYIISKVRNGLMNYATLIRL